MRGAIDTTVDVLVEIVTPFFSVFAPGKVTAIAYSEIAFAARG
ncbi:MAG TPA: hypothetical protein VF403_24075 [Kofleriaceae bacterium]